jgi:hypothetical protein
MNEAEWRKVLAGITSENDQDREETYVLVSDKFWNDDVLEKLKLIFDDPASTLVEKTYFCEAIAAIGLEKGIPILTKKRAEVHNQIKEQSEEAVPDDELHQLLSHIDEALKSLITKVKNKKEISLKNLVQKNFALK